MNNKYIVIKLIGNQTEKDWAVTYIKSSLQNIPNIELLEDTSAIYCSSKSISNEQLSALKADEYKDWLKHQIASEISKYLLEHELIDFTETKDNWSTRLNGTVCVFKDSTNQP